MSKRKIIIILGIVALVVLLFVGLIVVSNQKTNQTSETTGTNFFSNLFPFINTVSNTAEKVLNVLGIGGGENQEEQISLLQKVSSFPVAGYGIFMKERFISVPEMSPAVSSTETTPTETTAATQTATSGTETKQEDKTQETAITTPPTELVPILKYTEKATGNVYQTYVDSIDERKISSNVIPIVYDSLFAGNGASVIMRYLNGTNTIETFLKILPNDILGGDTTENTQNPGTFLTENITDMSISPTGAQIFYLFNSQGFAIGVTTLADGSTKTQVFASPFTEWLSQWPNDRMITLTTKATYLAPGYMYAVDPAKKDFNKILGGINGLTTLTSPNGRLVLYNTNNLNLYLYDIETGNSQSLDIKTLPEKCTWTPESDGIYCAVPKYIPSGQYPDSWYMGEVSFTDDVWFVDVINNNNSSMVLETSDTEPMDMIKLSTDANKDYLYFINKKDSYLWKFDL